MRPFYCAIESQERGTSHKQFFEAKQGKAMLSVGNSRLLWLLTIFLSLETGTIGSQLSVPPTHVLSVHLQSVSPFQALILLGEKYHVPLGIVAGTSTKLCAPMRDIELKNVTAEQAFTDVLSGSDYVLKRQGAMFLVQPRTLSPADHHLLNLRFSRFSGVHTTIQGLGIFLQAYIYSRLHHSQGGYAVDILSSPDSEQVRPFTMVNATVEQIANHIVGLGHLGAWILYPESKSGGPNRDARRLYIYGYLDDAPLLHALSCSRPN